MIEAKKSFGQNFLKDKNIIDKIVNSIDVTDQDLIIEIGPGQGALTKELKSKNATLLAFEIDERMKEVLAPLEDKKTKVIYKDILTVDLKEILSNYNYNKVYVIANLPYYITSPIIEKLISLNYIDEMTLMVQNEVADRFCAKPSTKDYGMMTVLLNVSYDVNKLFIVKNTCFTPVPKVDSAVINLKKKTNVTVLNNIDGFKKFISLAFMHKRKTLRNNIGNELFSKVESISNVITPNTRAEELSVDTYIEICNKLYK